jgi:hypothetical protein
MAWISELKRKLGTRVPRAERWPVTGLTAFYGLDFPSTPATIKNISSSGIYLGIQEPLPEGQLVALTLQMEGEPELGSELELMLQAQVARQDDWGAGLKFIQPTGLDEGLWEILVRGIAVLTDPEQMVKVFRTLRTVLFLCRLCRSEAEKAIVPLGPIFNQDRAATLFKVAHSAESLLTAKRDADRLRAHPKLVANLLRDSAWAADELTTKLWVGLLVSSCSVEEPDDSNQIFVDLLIQITPHQARILAHACELALRSLKESGDSTPVSVVLGPDEITRLTGVTDLARNATDLAYLFNLGVIQKVFDFTSYHEIDSFDITPSPLGLELYRHCQGERGAIDPELAAVAREHLAALLPPPIPSVFENYIPLVQDAPQND